MGIAIVQDPIMYIYLYIYIPNKWASLNIYIYIFRDMKSFWKEVKDLNNSKIPNVNNIDNVTGESNIANFWKDHYEKLLNSNNCVKKKNIVMDKLIVISHSNDMYIPPPPSEISNFRKDLVIGKAAGPDNLTAEYLKHAHLSVLLSLCFSSCLSHGFLQTSIMDTVVLPIVKNK